MTPMWLRILGEIFIFVGSIVMIKRSLDCCVYVSCNFKYSIQLFQDISVFCLEHVWQVCPSQITPVLTNYRVLIQMHHIYSAFNHVPQISTSQSYHLLREPKITASTWKQHRWRWRHSLSSLLSTVGITAQLKIWPETHSGWWVHRTHSIVHVWDDGSSHSTASPAELQGFQGHPRTAERTGSHYNHLTLASSKK